MLSESSLALRGFRRGTPPMRSAHLTDGQNYLSVQPRGELNEGH